MDCEISRLLAPIGIKGVKPDDGYPVHVFSDQEDNYGSSPKEQSYTVPYDNLTQFWLDYCTLVDEDVEAYHLAEYGREICPVIVDFSFLFPPTSDSEDPYDDDLVYFLIHTIQSVLLDYIDSDSPDYREMIVCHLVSDGEVNYEDGDGTYGITKFRFQFPFCHLSRSFQSTQLYPEILRRLKHVHFTNVFNDNPEGTWETSLNKKLFDKPIPLNGSKYPEDLCRLELNEILPYISEDKLQAFLRGQEDVIEDIQLSGLFDYRNHLHTREEHINPTMFAEKTSIEFWLPFYLSMEFWAVPTKLKQEQPRKSSSRRSSSRRSSSRRSSNRRSSSRKSASKGKERYFKSPRRPNYGKSSLDKTLYSSPSTSKYVITSSHDVDEDREDLEGDHFELIQDLLPLLHPKRFSKDSFWNEIIQAIHHSCEGNHKGLQLAKDYAKEHRSHHPSWEIECENLYRASAKSRITVKTVAWYAREDNPKSYQKWHLEWCRESMEEALTRRDNDIARSFYKWHWLNFLCTVSENGTVRWWEFKKHKWHDIHKGVRLKQRLSNRFFKRFGEYRTLLSRRSCETSDEGERLRCEADIKKIGALMGNLKSTASKGRIMTESIEFFLHDDFNAWMDENDNLTGVDNGILEICGEGCIFRNGKPEDFITKTAVVGYDPNFTMKHPLVQECMEWIHQVFPDEALARHFLKYCASFLKSGNREKFLVVFTGEGDNSKSMICKLLGLFGGYCVRLPLQCITQGRQRAGGANPEMARAKSAKIAIMQEPEDEDVLKGGIVKDVTGGEPFFARFLNENGGEIKNTFKLILMCNNIPSFTNPGKALKNRLRVIPFLSTWVKNAPKDPEERYRTRTFQMDPHFEDRIKFLMPAFLWILVEYYPIYAKEGLIDPPIIQETTDNYWKSTDVYYQFVEERLEEVYKPNGERDAGASVLLSKMYSEFKNFMMENYSNNGLPDRKIVSNNISEHIGPIHGRKWFGIRIKQRMANLPSLGSNNNSSFSNQGSSRHPSGLLLPVPSEGQVNNGILEV